MKKSKKLRIWSNVVGAIGLLATLTIMGVGVLLAGMATIPSFVPYIMIGASLLAAVSSFAGCAKLDKLAGQELYKETHQDTKTLEEIFENDKYKIIEEEKSVSPTKNNLKNMSQKDINNKDIVDSNGLEL